MIGAFFPKNIYFLINYRNLLVFSAILDQTFKKKTIV